MTLLHLSALTSLSLSLSLPLAFSLCLCRRLSRNLLTSAMTPGPACSWTSKERQNNTEENSWENEKGRVISGIKPHFIWPSCSVYCALVDGSLFFSFSLSRFTWHVCIIIIDEGYIRCSRWVSFGDTFPNTNAVLFWKLQFLFPQPLYVVFRFNDKSRGAEEHSPLCHSLLRSVRLWCPPTGH